MTRALALASILLLGAALAAQQPTFKVSVDLVSVDVLVTMRGQSVTGLAASDFEIRDNGVPQKIDSLSGEVTGSVSVHPVPLDVALVLDTSESMAGEKLELLAAACKGVLDRLRPRDRAALVTFSQRTVIRHPLSPEIASVKRAVDSLYATGRTSMFDALYTALSLRRASDTRGMVLLFSDGRDNTSWLGAAQILQVARESDVVVSAVGLDRRIKEDLKDVADETGGTVLVADSPKDLAKLFDRVVREMQARYVLNYYPSGVEAKGWHTLTVRVPAKGAEVVARRGYWRQ